MDYRKLGRTDIEVSTLCLGSMTWGEQNTEAEAHEQIDYALDQGINFIDTAEMYPVPPKAETQGRSEQYLGNWLATSGKREQVILVSKVAGRSNMDWFRANGETTRLTPQQIRSALEGSLRRLQTDYIDLYQLHWPDRSSNFFGKRDYQSTDDDGSVALADSLGELGRLAEEGKIRHVGLSNETAWGVMHSIACAERAGMPRIVNIQNPYNLLNRTFEIALAECTQREQIGLLAYSPLAFGVLTGKYLHGARPDHARLTLWERFSRYSSERGMAAAAHYIALAEKHGLSPAQMALAFVTSRNFVTSAIIGATSLDQLRNNIASMELTLSDDILERIEKIHSNDNNPCP